jgi:hypothetical protein
MEQQTNVGHSEASSSAQLMHVPKPAGAKIPDIEVPPEKANKDYFEDYNKLFFNNCILTEQYNGLRKENKELQEKLKNLEVVNGHPESYLYTTISGQPRG